MAFWNKGDDPWELDPERRKRQTEHRERAQALLEQAKGGLETVKATARGALKKNEEAPVDPMLCPWCGKPMVRQYLWSGKCVYLSGKKPDAFSSGFSADNRNIASEGRLLDPWYKTVWVCGDCRKLAVDLPEPEPYQAPWDEPPK